MYVNFGRKNGYKIVDGLPEVGQTRDMPGGQGEQTCISVEKVDPFGLELQYTRDFERYEPYIVEWKDEEGEIWTERIAIEREDYPL